jgi:hypothetical protein
LTGRQFPSNRRHFPLLSDVAQENVNEFTRRLIAFRVYETELLNAIDAALKDS